MQLIASVIKEGKPLSELSALMDIYPQKLINVSVKSKPEMSSVALVMEAIRQAKRNWVTMAGLVRAGNRKPLPRHG
jgi:phosphoglucosamine mutase